MNKRHPKISVILVKDFPDNVAAIADYIATENRKLTQMIAVGIQIIKYTADEGDQHGVNWQRVKQDLVAGGVLALQTAFYNKVAVFLKADLGLRQRLLRLQRSGRFEHPPPGDNPLLRSGLAFAGINSNAPYLGELPGENDGVLTVLEVLHLNLQSTRLVVLSACGTGLGEIHEGEGVYGLRSAFQEAGVAEVITSLWPVSDNDTRELMDRFYQKLLTGMTARQALRKTQLDMLASDQWSYPYVWSAFMLVGR